MISTPVSETVGKRRSARRGLQPLQIADSRRPGLTPQRHRQSRLAAKADTRELQGFMAGALAGLRDGEDGAAGPEATRR